MDLEYEGVLPGRIEIRRLQDPGVDLLPVEARVPELLRLREAQLREERVIDPGQPSQLLRRGLEEVDISHVRVVADRDRQP